MVREGEGTLREKKALERERSSGQVGVESHLRKNCKRKGYPADNPLIISKYGA
jgi:hypothetical protein